MARFYGSFRVGFVLSLVSACLISCTEISSQSQADLSRPTPALASARIEQDPAKDAELEIVVRQYCDLALEGKFDEIKQLVKVQPRPQKPLSKQEREQGMTFPDTEALFAELDKRALEKEFPEMIFTFKHHVFDLETLLQNETVGEVSVKVRSKFPPERSTTLIFKLHKVKNDWKIYYVTFKEIDDVLKEIDSERITEQTNPPSATL